MKKSILLFYMLAMFATNAFCNNIGVGALTIGTVDVGNQTVTVSFEVAWDNSWRTSQYESNYDAAWLFVKGRLLAGNQYAWQHVRVAATGHTFTPSGYGTGEIVNPSDRMGVFVQRDAANPWPGGISSYFSGTIQLTLDLSGTGFAESDGFDLCVEAIEMVYVPTGAFKVGDGSQWIIGTMVNVLKTMGYPNEPFPITSEGPITLGGNTPGSLHYLSGAPYVPAIDDFNTGNQQTLPAAFPKGYNHFYCMKYEISQGQFAEFLNKSSHSWYPGAPPHVFNSITGNPPAAIATIPDRACNFLNFRDGEAYANWAGLRPMTELEYEKACRGPRPAYPDELAWGTTLLSIDPYDNILDSLEISNPGTPFETVINVPQGPLHGFVNTVMDNGVYSQQLLRGGIFAASFGNPSRANAGATYYGIMEMSGNVTEQCVAISDSLSRQFVGEHGNGGSAYFLPPSWNALTRCIPKGGSYLNRAGIFISNRRTLITNILGVNVDGGFRCVRTAP